MAMMRLSQRNKRPLWYANPTGQEITPAEESMGESLALYTEPSYLPLNVSEPSGEASAEPFGSFANYERIAAAEKNCPIQLNALVWLEHDPRQDAVESPDGVMQVNSENCYRVVQVGDSLNYIRYALRRVEGVWSFGYVSAKQG